MKKFAVLFTVFLIAVALTGCVEDSPENADPSKEVDNVDTPSDSSQTADSSEQTGEDDGKDNETDLQEQDIQDSGGELDDEESNTQGGEVSVTISDVTDGDTVDIRYQNGTIETVRLLGLDTPEVHTGVSPNEFEGVPDNQAGRDCLRRWGEKASSYAKSELSGESVGLSFDENEGRRGYYGRLLGYIHVNEDLFNYNLVENGYARVYDDSDFVRQEEFYNAESQAQNSNTGLWECTEVSSNTDVSGSNSDSVDTTTSSSSLEVTQIHEDAAGDERDNLNDEYIVFENTGSSTLDLSGWSVSDDVDHTYRFPDDFEVGSGETVTLRTGSGSDTDTELYWDSSSPIWNNNGDTVIVENGAGEVVISREY
jgi:micrococcal nuclease